MDISLAIIRIIVVVLSISLHEFGHAKVADLAGDPTPRQQGRVTLNPVSHFDLLGFIMVCVVTFSGMGIGWGKPVMVNPNKMKDPRWDHFLSVLAGPLMNCAIFTVCGLLLRLALHGTISMPAWLTLFLLVATLSNIGLMLFNLLPVGPLDGHWLIGAFLPASLRYRWYRFSQVYGSIFLLIVIFGLRGTPYDILSKVLEPAIERVFQLVVGLDLPKVP